MTEDVQLALIVAASFVIGALGLIVTFTVADNQRAEQRINACRDMPQLCTPESLKESW